MVWNLDVDTKGLDSGLSSAKKSVDSAASDIEKRGDKMVGVLKNAAFAIGAAIGTAAGAFAVLGVKTAADLESATQGFVALLGSADEASDVIARIKREAASTPFEIAGLAAGTQAITAITKDGNKAIDIILDVGKAIAISGKGQAEFDNVVANLQQIAATGKVTELDVRQFQRAIPIFNDIIGAVGLTSEELKDASNASDLLFNAFKVAGAEGGIAAEGFSAQAGTFNQLMSNLKDTIAITSSDVVTQTGLFDLMKLAVEGLSESISGFGANITTFLLDNKDEIEFAISVITAGVNGMYDIIVDVVTYLADHKAAVLGFFTGMSAVILFNSVPAVVSLATQFGILALSMAPLVIAGGLFALLFGFLDKFSTSKTGFGLIDQAAAAVDILTGNSEAALRAYRTLIDEIDANISRTKARFDIVGQLRATGQLLNIPGFADGVRGFSGGLAVVGERGPELVNLPKGSDVYSNDEIGGIGGGRTVNIINNMTVRRDSDMDAFSRRLSFEAQTI